MPAFSTILWRMHSCVQRSQSCERASGLTRLVTSALPQSLGAKTGWRVYSQSTAVFRLIGGRGTLARIGTEAGYTSAEPDAADLSGPEVLRYSSFNASAGSTFVASSAESQAAPVPTPSRTSPTAANIPILHGLTPSGRMSLNGRIAATARGRPTATPQARTTAPSLTAVRRIVTRSAPIAARIAISRVRRRVAWETEL